MENSDNWSKIVKEEKKPFNLNEWPTLEGKIVVKSEDLEVVEQRIPMDSPEDVVTFDFPPIEKSVRKAGNNRRRRKAYQLSQQISNEKPFETRYSSRVKKRITQSTQLGSFMNKKTAKRIKNAEIEMLMQKIKESQIVTFKGKKREIPKRKMTRLKKNILKVRAAKLDKEKVVDPIDLFTEREATDPEVIESIEKLKLNEEEDLVSNDPVLPNKNPFQCNKIIVQHSRQFRSYCTNLTSKLLCELTENLLVRLRIFQTKKHLKDPERVKKRYITGLNEIRKFLDLKWVKLLIIAPDLEPNAALDETVGKLKSVCDENQVPYLFSLKRRKIGYILFKKVPVSCVGILNYEGAEEIYVRLMDELAEQVMAYKNATIVS